MIMRVKLLTPAVIAISFLIMVSCTTQEDQPALMPLSSDSELALEFYHAGMLAFDQLQWEMSYHSLQMAVKQDPDFFMAYFWLYFINRKSDNNVLDDAFKVDAQLSDGELEIQQGLKYLVSGQDEKAVEHLRAATEMYPSDPHVHKILYILQFHHLHNTEDAIASMKRAIEEVPDYDLVYNQLGYAYMDEEEYDKAEEAFDTYIRLSPDIANPYDSKGDFYMSLKEYQKAYDSYMKAYSIDPGFTVSKKKSEKALQLLEKK